MTGYHLEPAADHRLDEIYVFTRDHWGEDQADRYILGLFACFDAIAAHELPWRQIPANVGIDGYVRRYEKHFIYWKERADGTIAIFAILHERMDQSTRLTDDLAP